MPKVFITEEQRRKDDLVALIYGKMQLKKITQKQLSERIGIGQTGMSAKLIRKNFKYEDLVEIFDTLDFTDQQILSVMRKGRV